MARIRPKAVFAVFLQYAGSRLRVWERKQEIGRLSAHPRPPSF